MTQTSTMILNKLINQIESLEYKIAENVIIISDLTLFIFIHKLSYEDISLFLKKIIEIFTKKRKSIIFPSFINPSFNKGVINLDILKSDSGVLSEIFRKFPGVKRTKNPYFSYCILGKNQKQFISIDPEYDWSKKSHLGWMEKNNISCFIIGTFPENNPLVHRAEFINKDIIKYKQIKKFRNKIIYEGKKLNHEQYYLNYKKGFDYIYYKGLFEKYSISDIDSYSINGLSVHHYRANVILELVNKEIHDNIFFRNGKKKKSKSSS